MNAIVIFGRLCLAAIFVYGSITGILDFSMKQEMIANKGLPIPTVLLLGNIVFQIVGAISLITGLQTRWGSLVLIVFLVPTTLVFHNFWVNSEETIPFLKNLGLIGGLLMVYSLASYMDD
ncbi:DoxX family protein [Geitlerinema sp. PCC 9228]|uniref:DoxX family protein n=1 Tax=Geitlerinema sp. PCC 9228 TaxID=111611 RepID=UPI0008F9869E|nr:DoxX family protein [Geitlerinema sp. PCC 9228]